MKKQIFLPKKIYKVIHTHSPIACVDIVVKYGNKFLLGKRKNKPVQNKWWFPGGRILKGETFKRAVIRKVKEETGLSVKIIRYLGIDETIFPDGPFGKPSHTINIVFLVTPIGSNHKITRDSQHDEFQWFSQINKKWHPYLKKFLELAGFY